MNLAELQVVVLQKIMGDPANGALGIYQANTRMKRFNALKNVYPVCEALVGVPFFKYIGLDFIKKTPSFSPDLNTYGQQFFEFLKHHPKVHSLPYLSEVARLEWFIHQALMAEEGAPIDFLVLAEHLKGQMDIGVRLVPSAALIQSPYPILRIWEVNQAGYSGDQTVSLEEEGVFLLVWRKALELQIERLSPLDWELLSAIQDQELRVVEKNQALLAAWLLKGCLQLTF